MNTEPLAVFPFFTGCQRSGTTLARVIFAAHPEMAIPGESHFIPPLIEDRATYERREGFDVERFVRYVAGHERFKVWHVPEKRIRRALDAAPIADLPDAIRRLYAAYAKKKGKPRYGDKTPRYAVRLPMLAEQFPEARFVHVVRDGRDVALSLLEVPWGVKRVEQGAMAWRRRVLAARQAGRALGPARYLEYRHEDLIEDPEREVRRICSFLDLKFDPAMLRYHEDRKPAKAPHMQHLAKPPTKGLRDWRNQMKREDVRVFELLAGRLLAELGYELGTDDSTLDSIAEAAARKRARRIRRRQGGSSQAPRRGIRGALGRIARVPGRLRSSDQGKAGLS
jgi:hypothetical protein